MKGKYCTYKPALFCQENSGCENCMIPNKEFNTVTIAKCSCGWSGKVEECKQKTEYEANPNYINGELIDIDFDERIVDLCPACFKNGKECEVNYE
jgi:hypothetical protein